MPVSVEPTLVVPETVGAAVLVGMEPTAAVDAVYMIELPVEFVAVTLANTYRLASVEVKV